MCPVLSVLFLLLSCAADSTIDIKERAKCRLSNGDDGLCYPFDQCIEIQKTQYFDAIYFDDDSKPVFCDETEDLICCPVNIVKNFITRFGEADEDDGIIYMPDENVGDEMIFDENREPGAVINRLGNGKSIIMCQKYKEEKKISLTPLIIDGTEVKDGEYPHMVALGYLRNKILTFECGGSLISDRFVLTAGHCILTRDNTTPWLVRMGITKVLGEFDTSFTDYLVEKSIPHPKYKRKYKYFDIALLRLAKPVKFTINKFPACLNTDEEVNNKILTILGWGETDPNRQSESNILMKANVMTMLNSECYKIYAKEIDGKFSNGIVAEHLCARDANAAGHRDTCSGDSGGPLQDSIDKDMFTIVGVTSFSFGKCGSRMGTVYTRVSSYLDWLEPIVWP